MFKKSLPKLCLALSLIATSLSGYTAPSNPVSESFVRRLIQDALNSLNLSSTLTAGSGISITNDTISTDPFLSIGDFYQGGVVFYVDATGRHGLIVSLNDQSTSVPWFGGCDSSGGTACPQLLAQANGNGAGLKNTVLMVDRQALFDVSATNAGIVASTFSVESATGKNDANVCNVGEINSAICVGDWYLPSSNELVQLLTQTLAGTLTTTMTTYGGTLPETNAPYWASNESSTSPATNAVAFSISGGVIITVGDFKEALNYRARAIRTF